jgi:hypothetical protein
MNSHLLHSRIKEQGPWLNSFLPYGVQAKSLGPL